MQIDWITVIAQIVNFLILVYLLRRFLYQPVVQAMQRREERISEQLHEARTREEKAEAEVREYRQKTEELEREKAELLEKARNEADAERKRMLEEAREDVAQARKEWHRQTEQEKEDFLRNLKHQSSGALQAIARKVLADLADVELEERIVDSFLRRLKDLDRKARSEFDGADERVEVATAFELDSSTRSQLTRTIHDLLVEGAEIEYTVKPDLMCGIELTSAGRKLSWNLSEYLKDLNEDLGEAFDAVASTEESHAAGSAG